MVERITWSTYSGEGVSSGDRGLASPAKKASIPRSGSFAESCTLVSEGWMARVAADTLRTSKRR
jgi:hypothetical protein